MPLLKGHSRKTIAANIRREVLAGKSRDQASAIAYAAARKSFRARHPGKPLPGMLKDRKNPVASKEKASRDYERFHGSAPRKGKRMRVPEPKGVCWELGRVLSIAYETQFDGKRERFLHDFRKDCAPFAVVNGDGQLLLADGDYRVTERGITDGKGSG